MELSSVDTTAASSTRLPRVSGKMIGKALGIQVAGMAVGVAFSAVAQIAGGGPTVWGWGTAAASAVTVGLLIVLFRHNETWRAAKSGFIRPQHSLLHLIWIAPVGIILSQIAGTALSELMRVKSDPVEDQNLLLGLPLDEPVVWASIFCASAIAPVTEEIVFRGVVYTWLVSHVPPVAAIAVCGCVFALFHLTPSVVLTVLPLGVFLSALRWWYDSVIPGVIVHMFVNMLASLLLVLDALSSV